MHCAPTRSAHGAVLCTTSPVLPFCGCPRAAAGGRGPGSGAGVSAGVYLPFCTGQHLPPYVEKYTREQGITHCEIETEFDNQLMREDGLDPLRFFTAGHIRPTEENARIIAPLQWADHSPGGGCAARHGDHPPLPAGLNPAKRWLVLTVMRLAGKYDDLHGLVANPQPNPDCAEAAASWSSCTPGSAAGSTADDRVCGGRTAGPGLSAHLVRD